MILVFSQMTVTQSALHDAPPAAAGEYEDHRKGRPATNLPRSAYSTTSSLSARRTLRTLAELSPSHSTPRTLSRFQSSSHRSPTAVAMDDCTIPYLTLFGSARASGAPNNDQPPWPRRGLVNLHTVVPMGSSEIKLERLVDGASEPSSESSTKEAGSTTQTCCVPLSLDALHERRDNPPNNLSPLPTSTSHPLKRESKTRTTSCPTPPESDHLRETLVPLRLNAPLRRQPCPHRTVEPSGRKLEIQAFTQWREMLVSGLEG
ncbi:hypothetical protein R3P38DRAFT_3175356 [Favolaschia claudopus]|uniref:Uncharacterized protein n=1 Tax=Favolaschia claudopus TaxID=2862362 RepID=A0AAW0DEY6_9AGAR